MRRGFTLLEIIIVIIIIGVLATLGFTQYGRMVERSRGAEARAICGDIRKFASAFRIEQGTLAGFGNAQANIAAGNIPGPAAANCALSHYFWYQVAVADPVLTITATRCTATGKVPNSGAADTLVLTSNMATGVDTWTSAFGY